MQVAYAWLRSHLAHLFKTLSNLFTRRADKEIATGLSPVTGQRACEEATSPAGLRFYSGFKEKLVRIVYLYDIEGHPPGRTCTITPDGAVENPPKEVTLSSTGSGRAIIAYPFKQSISESNMAVARRQLEKHGQGEFLSNVAFKRADGSIALVQSWKALADQGFFNRFEIVDTDRANRLALNDEFGLREFAQSLKRLFGGVSHLPGKFLVVEQKQWTTNHDGLVCGTGDSVLRAMKSKSLPFFGDTIASVDVAEHYFESFAGERTKRFYISPHANYAVYKNMGRIVVPTPWHQFCMNRTRLDGEPFDCSKLYK